jgi:hypothetical protein
LIAVLSTVAGLGAAWAFWDQHRRDPWQRLARRITRRLKTLEIAAAPHDTPRQLASRVRQQLGTDGAALATQLEALEAQRYGRDALARPSNAWWRAFVQATAAATPSR